MRERRQQFSCSCCWHHDHVRVCPCNEGGSRSGAKQRWEQRGGGSGSWGPDSSANTCAAQDVPHLPGDTATPYWKKQRDASGAPAVACAVQMAAAAEQLGANGGEGTFLAYVQDAASAAKPEGEAAQPGAAAASGS